MRLFLCALGWTSLLYASPLCLKFLKEISITPEPRPANRYSYHEVTNSDGSKTFVQQEVALETLPKVIQIQLVDLRKHSMKVESYDKIDFQEAGFFVAELADGPPSISNIVSSGNPDQIFFEDLDPAFSSFLKSLKGKKLKRVQFYHSHPPLDPMARTISRSDVDAALKYQYLLGAEGHRVPFDMHVAAIDLITDGFDTIYHPPPVGTPPVFDAQGRRIPRPIQTSSLNAPREVFFNEESVLIAKTVLRMTVNP